MHPTYDIAQSYEWNYEHGPVVDFSLPIDLLPRRATELFGFRINSPLGVPAGPLLHSGFIELYAKLGFDVPVYKTVRSRATPCLPDPNIVFVHPAGQLRPSDTGGRLIGDTTPPASTAEIAITNSFGVPSQPPAVWQRDVEVANSKLQDGQVMIVSVMGTQTENESIEKDYARAAAMAVEAGAKIIEANYSCPNLCTGEGQIFADPETSSRISKEIREAIGAVPFLIKMGTMGDRAALEQVVAANLPYVDGFAGINTVQMTVNNSDGSDILPGRQKSGVCGAAIRETGRSFTRDMAALREKLGYFTIIGCGGVTTEADIDARLAAGADVVMSATAAMWDPFLASRWRQAA